MSDKPETDESGEESAAVPRPSPLAALRTLLQGPKKKLIIVGGAGLLILSVLILAIVLSLSLMREPEPEPETEPEAEPVSAAPPAAQPATETEPKAGVEGRFEALKRGDFSVLPPKRGGQDAADNPPPAAAVEAPVAPEAPPARAASAVKEPAPALTQAREPVPAAESPAAPPPTPNIAGGECAVGGSDAKASAAAILSCIKEFNALDARAQKHRPAKKPPPAN